MDAYSMTCTSPTVRQMSRIYQDLKSIHFQSISSLSSKHFETSTEIMGAQSQVGGIQRR